MQTLAGFLFAIAGTLAGRVLFSLGFGVFSYAALTAAASAVVSAAQTKYNGAGSTVLQLLNLGGIGESLGIISAALITRATLSAFKRMRPV